MREVNAIPGSVLNLGYQGENDATRVLFDLSDFIEEYGAGTAQLAVQVPGDPGTYLAVIEQSGSVAVWTVGAEWLARAGSGRCQINWYVGEQIVKSQAYGTSVAASIGEGVDAPEPYEPWLEKLAQGGQGTTFTPSVSADGVISWTNDGGKANPDPVNIMGPQGPQGETGPAGPAYTLTETDKTELVAAVIAALPVYNGEVTTE